MNNNEKLLIIEDTQELVELLFRKFEKSYEVHSAFDGEGGIKKAEEILPDLILLDVNLPDVSGFDLLGRLKASEATREIPVLIMTAMSDTESVVTGFGMGAEDYLVKPFNFTELSARVNAHLTIRRLTKKLLEMEKLKTLRELTVSFNHEINNPLMAINAFAHYIRNRTGDSCVECRNSAEGIMQEVSRISEKVRLLSEATRAVSVDYQPGIRMIDLEGCSDGDRE